MKIYPNLNLLKQNLGIKNINTGKMFTHNSSPNGIVFDDIEQLTHIGTIDNKIVLKSGTELTFNQYRGQVKDFDICNANLFREKTKEQIFLQICRTIAFENLLGKHPYLKLIKIMNSEIYINNTAIAQHYELKTPFLDLTSNFDVATFFATSEYNPLTKKYEPYSHKSDLGVIYVYNEIHSYSSENMLFEYIGWQGLPRPEEQRASIYHLTNNEDFNNIKGVTKYYFKHSLKISKKIWNKFKKGKVLFPNDSAGDLANECKKLTSFTQDELNSALFRLGKWTDFTFKDNDIKKIYEKLDINIVKSAPLNWNNLVDTSESYWLEKLSDISSKVKYRKSIYV